MIGTSLESQTKRTGSGDLTKLTLSMTKEDKRALKTYAAERDKTVAKVIREWVDEKCRGAR